MIEIELPDGTIAEFPAGTSNDVIKGALQKRFGAQKSQSPQMQGNMNELSAMTKAQDFGAGDRAAFDALPGWQKPLVATGDLVGLAANGATMGFGDKAVATARSAFTDKSYDEELEAARTKTDQSRNRAGTAGMVAEIGGSILTGGGLAKGGLTLAGRGGNMLSRMGLMGIEGAGYGAVSALGNDQDVLTGAGVGALAGGAGSVIAPLGSKVIDYGKSIIGKGNDNRAKMAIIEALQRSGRSADDVGNDLMQSVGDGQDVYTLADAMGNSGQRMLSGIARSPGDSRQVIADALMSRQSGQGDRLTSALVEGFDAPMTAAQKQAALTASRKAQANVNYGQAREGAGPVDVSGAIQQADNFLMPGANNVVSSPAGIAENSVEGLVSRAKSYLTDGKSNLSNFDATFRAKRELDRMIKQNPDVGELYGVRDALDDALAASSPKYSNARDTYRQGSKDIEGVDAGMAAQSGRVRSQNSIPAFQNMKPTEQDAFRTGYTDPLIAKIQSSAGDMTNKARMLRSDKAKAEFPAFAAQGKGDQLNRRIEREMVMSKTMQDALGGSKTFDNMQDGAELAGLDPSMVGNILRGNFAQAALSGVTKLSNAATGRNAATRDMIARALMSTGKEGNKQIAQAIETGKKLTASQEKIIRALMLGGLATQNGQP